MICDSMTSDFAEINDGNRTVSSKKHVSTVRIPRCLRCSSIQPPVGLSGWKITLGILYTQAMGEYGFAEFLPPSFFFKFSLI